MRLREYGSGGGGEECQWALAERRTGSAQGAPQRGHGAALEPLAQLGDAPSSVLAVTIIVEATELVGVQAVKVGVG